MPGPLPHPTGNGHIEKGAPFSWGALFAFQKYLTSDHQLIDPHTCDFPDLCKREVQLHVCAVVAQVLFR